MLMQKQEARPIVIWVKAGAADSNMIVAMTVVADTDRDRVVVGQDRVQEEEEEEEEEDEEGHY